MLLWPGLALIVALVLWLGGRSATVSPPEVPDPGPDRAVREAVAQARDAVRVHSRDGAGWGRLGMVFQNYDFPTEAKICFVRAEELDSHNPRWPYFHGLLLLPTDLREGIARLERAAVLCSDQPDAPRLRLVEILTETGQFDTAERHLDELLRGHPDNPVALLRLARLNDARGRVAESLALVQRCVSDPHTAKSALTLLAALKRKQGEVALADAALRQAAALLRDASWPDPFLDEARRLHVGRKGWVDEATRLTLQGNFAEALPLITRVVKEYPEAPEGWLLLGQVQLEQNDCVRAEQSVRQHLRLAPQSVNGQHKLGTALLCQERYREAADCFAAAVRLKPDFGEAHFNLGFARARAGQGREALQNFRDAIRYNPDFIDPYFTLADLLGQLGEKAEARALLERARALNPADERGKFLGEKLR